MFAKILNVCFSKFPKRARSITVNSFKITALRTVFDVYIITATNWVLIAKKTNTF